MGAFKKRLKSDVSRAARMVISRYYLESKGKPLQKRRLNSLVKKAEKEVVPAIMERLKGNDQD